MYFRKTYSELTSVPSKRFATNEPLGPRCETVCRNASAFGDQHAKRFAEMPMARCIRWETINRFVEKRRKPLTVLQKCLVKIMIIRKIRMVIALGNLFTRILQVFMAMGCSSTRIFASGYGLVKLIYAYFTSDSGSRPSYNMIAKMWPADVLRMSESANYFFRASIKIGMS